MKVGRRILRAALVAGSALGLTAGGSVLAVASGPVAQAATACAAAWSSTAVYTAGNQASENGINYTANWWTQGNDPATNNGGSGSGQPWTSNGACTGGSSGGGGGGGGTGTGTGSVSGLLFSPYKDVTINMNWNTDEMQSAVEGSDLPVVGSNSLVSEYIPKLPAITLAFATGTCGSETWGGVSGADWAAENIPQLQNANLDYVVSTGGEAGTFSCDSTAGMDAFIARYASPNLVGMDFDIEGGQTESQIQGLVDAAAGIVNHYRRRPGQWTVSSELSMDLSLDGAGDLDGPVLATAHALGPLGATSLGICELTYRNRVIGGGTVRSFFIDAEDVVPQLRLETLRRSGETTFADLTAVHVVDHDSGPVLAQRVDGNLNNDIDIVHGGVAAAGLELAASAALNRDRSDGLLQTASLRVNFLRPFFAGSASRYEGTPLRVGRNTGVGDAQAIGDDGKVAITARITSYR